MLWEKLSHVATGRQRNINFILRGATDSTFFAMDVILVLQNGGSDMMGCPFLQGLAFLSYRNPLFEPDHCLC